jgi:hypothetical protein
MSNGRDGFATQLRAAMHCVYKYLVLLTQRDASESVMFACEPAGDLAVFLWLSL